MGPTAPAFAKMSNGRCGLARPFAHSKQVARMDVASLIRLRLLILFLLCAIFQDDSQRIRCRRPNEFQGIRVMMIEWAVSPLHQKLGFNDIGPASVVVEGDVT